MAKSARSSIFRGSAGMQKADEVIAQNKVRAEERKNRVHDPFRFKVADGESTQFIIVDDAPDFYRFEHCMQDPVTKIWNVYTGCINEHDNCPVCIASKRESYYALYLTVIDFTPFTTKSGERVEFSKKLLVVKSHQQKKFHRAYQKALKEGGTLRGMLFETARDGAKESSIGNDIEFLEYVPEDELTTYVREWKDKDGKVHVEDCSEPFDYEALFEEPTAESLRAIVGGDAPVGNREGDRASLRRPSARNNTGMGAARRNVSRRGAEAEPEDAEPDDDAAAGEYEAPSRTSRMRSAAPARETTRERTRPTRGVPERAPATGRRTAPRREEQEYEDDVPETRAPARRGVAPARGREAAAPSRRPVPGVGRRLPPADDNPDDDDIPF